MIFDGMFEEEKKYKKMICFKKKVVSQAGIRIWSPHTKMDKIWDILVNSRPKISNFPVQCEVEINTDNTI